MGRIFSAQGQQFEVCSAPGRGVWYTNLTTQVTHRIEHPGKIPQTWPQDIKDSLAGCLFTRSEQCHLCMMPESPLCGCFMGMDNDPDWRTPAVMSKTPPMPTIDPLNHCMVRVRTSLELLCHLPNYQTRMRQVHGITALIRKYTERQALIAKHAQEHHEAVAEALRRYGRHSYDTISRLRSEQREAFKSSRTGLMEAIQGKKICVSCHEKRPCCVTLPCTHASMCTDCWKTWATRSDATCPECRAPVETVFEPCD